MYFQGNNTNKIKIGRDMGWGAISNVIINGNVGIGIANPNRRFYISSNLATSATVYAMWISSGASTDAGGFGTLKGSRSELNGWSKCAIGHTRMGPYDTGDIVFLTNNSWDTTDCSMSNERMRITRTGRIGVANTNPQSMLH